MLDTDHLREVRLPFITRTRPCTASTADPERASVIVCHCHRVTDARVDGVLAAGADGVRGVVRATRAGTGCGGCIPVLRELCARSSAATAECHAPHDEALAG